MSRGADPAAVPRVALGLGALLLVYYAVPFLALAGSAPTALARLDDPTVVSATTTTLVATTASTLLALAFGVPLAYWLSRRSGPLADVLTGVVAAPLVLPPVAAGLLLLTVVGPSGLGGPLAAVGIQPTRSLVGVVLAQTFVASPFLVITAKASFERVDRHAEQVARTLGADGFETFRTVTLPLAWRGVLAGATLTFARAAGEFGATALLAYRPRTMPVQIWVSFLSAGTDAALPVAALLVGASLLALAALNALGAGTVPWR